MLRLKVPKECSETELDAFENLVKEGGEVSSSELRLRIERAAYLSWIEADNGEFIGVGAIKNPNTSYRSSIFKKADPLAKPDLFGLELGWIFIKPAFRKQGLSSQLITKLLDSVKNKAIFASTREDNEIMKSILQSFGFNKIGNPYLSNNGNYDLVLFVKNS